tara:strand:+ start:1710 stop:2957 length:1248 start_codon:yes stop_codon:yes gene_type:complete
MKNLPLTPKVRDNFPIFKRKINGYPLAFLDNSSTTQKPYSVIDALVNFYSNHNSNVSRGVYKLAEEATEIYESGRDHVARFIGAESSDEVIFTGGTTDSINLVANGWLKNKLEIGSKIIVTEIEHHSNLVPWQISAQSTGAALLYWEKNSEGRLDLEDLQKLINGSVKLIAITAVSNVLGTINLINKIIKIAHLNSIPVLVDAAQALARIPVNVKEWDCDFLAFSGHKVYGPNGIGVLYSKKERIEEMIPIKGGGGMISYVGKQKSDWASAPQKFEAGTPAIAEVYGLTKAIEFIELYGIAQIQKHEEELTSYVLKRFNDFEDLILYGPKDTVDRVGIVSFNLRNLHAHDVAQVLDDYGIAVRAGHHCTNILHQTLGVVASVRISFAIYNHKLEIDRLLEALKKTKELFFTNRKN